MPSENKRTRVGFLGVYPPSVFFGVNNVRVWEVGKKPKEKVCPMGQTFS